MERQKESRDVTPGRALARGLVEKEEDTWKLVGCCGGGWYSCGGKLSFAFALPRSGWSLMNWIRRRRRRRCRPPS